VFGRELVAIDGSQFGAVNSPSRNFSPKRLEQRIADIDTQIAAYLKQLDRQDREEASSETGKPEEFQDKLRRWQERKQRYQSYQQLVEHPFGTMKHWMEQGCFLMRRKEKVATEMSLTVLAYNLKRVLNLVGTQKLIAALA
jgi:hypothetical protein